MIKLLVLWALTSLVACGTSETSAALDAGLHCDWTQIGFYACDDMDDGGLPVRFTCDGLVWRWNGECLLKQDGGL